MMAWLGLFIFAFIQENRRSFGVKIEPGILFRQIPQINRKRPRRMPSITSFLVFAKSNEFAEISFTR